MELAVVMQTEPEVFEDVLDRLRAEGYHPVALSDPASGERYYPGSHPYARTRAIVYIAVPPDERAAVEVFLRKLQEGEATESKKVAAAVRKDAFVAVMASVVLGVLLYMSGRQIDTVVFMSAGVGAMVFLAGCIRRNLPEDGGRDDEG
jgi:hypothetical protein